MLTVNPGKRITAAEALKHPWICVRLIIVHFKCTLIYLFRDFPATGTCCVGGAQARDRGLSQEVQREAQAQGEYAEYTHIIVVPVCTYVLANNTQASNALINHF